MISFLAVSSIETLVENNLALFAIGHIGLVLVLLVFFFNLNSNKLPKESNVRDEEAFDYGTEDGSLFRSNTEGSIPLKALKQEQDAAGDPDALDEPIVFNSQISDEHLPDGMGEVESKAEEAIRVEAEEETSESDETDVMAAALTSIAEEEQNTEARKQTRIQEILASVADKKAILINRDETILDINAQASELFQYLRADIEGKKIDEIIFLEEAEEQKSDANPEGYQRAKGRRKDESQFPVQVELEMADREFGIITVTLHPAVFEEDAPVEAPATEGVQPEPTPPPVETSAPPPRTKPLPPPPRPKTPANALALQSPGSMITGGRPVDSKTIEMFSSQLSQPLQSIVQLAQLISSDEKAIPHLKKYAVAIQAKSNRLMSQIEEMSMLASVQKSEITVKEQPFNLGNLISSLVNLTANLPGENNPKIHYNRGENDLIVMSDEEQFEKVLSNLINITLNSVEKQDVDLFVQSEIVKHAPEPAKTVNFKGQKLEINATRRLSISAQFPGDEHTNRFFDVSINRPENPLVQKLQSSSSLKNHMSSIRLMKELAKSLGGKLHFSADEQQIGQLQLELELPCVEVAAYPS